MGPMPNALDWEMLPGPTGTTVSFSGRLDGNGQLVNQLVPILRDTRLVFDTAGIRRITSPGVAEWIKFLDAVDARGLVYHFDRCSLAFVQQLNMVSIFRGKGDVRSVFAPFFCRKCDLSHERLVECTDGAQKEIENPPVCARCGQKTEFDDVVELFFGFLTKRSGY